MATKIRQIKTTRQAIAKLGGLRATALITGARYNAVCNWLAAPQFPARYFLVMSTALRERGATAPPELWGQEQGNLKNLNIAA